MDHADIIKRLGGATVVSAALGIRASNTVAYWQRRGIPALYWSDIARLSVDTECPLSVEDIKATSPLSRVPA